MPIVIFHFWVLKVGLRFGDISAGQSAHGDVGRGGPRLQLLIELLQEGLGVMLGSREFLWSELGQRLSNDHAHRLLTETAAEVCQEAGPV